MSIRQCLILDTQSNRQSNIRLQSCADSRYTTETREADEAFRLSTLEPKTFRMEVMPWRLMAAIEIASICLTAVDCRAVCLKRAFDPKASLCTFASKTSGDRNHNNAHNNEDASSERSRRQTLMIIAKPSKVRLSSYRLLSGRLPIAFRFAFRFAWKSITENNVEREKILLSYCRG